MITSSIGAFTLASTTVNHMEYKAHQAVPIYEGLISYVAPNAAMGMIIDAHKTVRHFRYRDILHSKGETTQTVSTPRHTWSPPVC